MSAVVKKSVQDGHPTSKGWIHLEQREGTGLEKPREQEVESKGYTLKIMDEFSPEGGE